jgi:hypothetical protein
MRHTILTLASALGAAVFLGACDDLDTADRVTRDATPTGEAKSSGDTPQQATPQQATPQQATPQQGTAQQATPPIEQLKAAPSQYVGRSITLAGKVENVRNNRSFTLEGDEWFVDDELLVVTKSPVKIGIGTEFQGSDVVVTGTVRNLVIAEIERDLGWDLEQELETRFRDKPVLVADSIRVVGDVARWSEQNPEGELAAAWLIRTLPTPESLVGQRIRLDEARIQSKTGDVLWVGDTHADQMMVVPPVGTDLAGLAVGDPIWLTGTLQKLPAADEAITRWKIDESLRKQLSEEVLYVEATGLAKRPTTGPT